MKTWLVAHVERLNKHRGAKQHVSRLVGWLMVIGCVLIPPSLSAQTSSKQRPMEALGALSEAFEALAERVSPAVVKIIATGYTVVPGEGSTGLDLLTEQRSGGSGLIVDADGYIVTNAHVVAGAQRIRVLVAVPLEGGPPGRSILKPTGKMVDAHVVGVDQETDLAVLKIPERGLPVLALGDSDELRPGQLVLAFGSPLGLENSVTMGVVSSVARQLEPDDPMVYIQTDASINPGNSGGPLVDTSGRVVGINTLIFSQSGGSEGIGFAAPSNIVRRVFQQIRQYGRVRRGVIGVQSQTITPTLAKGLALTRDWGVIVGDVVPGSPADRVGLEVGDIVLTLDGKVMENARQFNVNLYRRAPGDVVTVEVLRGAEKITLPVQVVERPDDLNRFAELVNPEKNLVRELGILGVELDANIAPMLPGLRKRTGVLVAAGAAGGRPGQSKFLPGDVIYAVNRAPITSLDQLRSAVAKLKAGDPLVMQIQRLGQLMFIALEME